MGLYINQKNSRSELQERLAAELRDKAKKRAELEDQERPDGVDDSQFIKNTKQTTSLAWVWLLIAIASIALILYVVVATS